MRSLPIITLTTDFGTRDGFVGTMKGVILGIKRGAAIIDLTHEVPPGDIRAGAFVLMTSCSFFPKETIHVAVVDPGVGSDRKAIAVRTKDYVFIGPDNGVLSWVLERETVRAVHTLPNERYFLHPRSRTFHGRDIFAPVAAHLSGGLDLKRLGPSQRSYVKLPRAKPEVARGAVHGQVMYIDRFGNAITSIDTETLGLLGGRDLGVYLGGKLVCRIAAFYQAVPQGKPVAVLGSSGCREIAINGANAAKRLKLRIGERLTLRPR